LRITKKDASERTTETEIMNAILTVLALAVCNKQTAISKSMISNPEWFDGNQMKFED